MTRKNKRKVVKSNIEKRNLFIFLVFVFFTIYVKDNNAHSYIVTNSGTTANVLVKS